MLFYDTATKKVSFLRWNEAPCERCDGEGSALVNPVAKAGLLLCVRLELLDVRLLLSGYWLFHDCQYHKIAGIVQHRCIEATKGFL